MNYEIRARPKFKDRIFWNTSKFSLKSDDIRKKAGNLLFEQTTVHIPAPWQLNPVGVRWMGNRSVSIMLISFPNCFKIAQSTFANFSRVWCVCIRVLVSLFSVYVRTWVRCALCVNVRLLSCMFVCICLQSGRSQIFHIYMIQLACVVLKSYTIVTIFK